MDKVRNAFNALPSTLKVILYSGLSSLLGVLLVFTNGEESFDWRKLLAVVITTAINVVAYLILREKESGSQG